MQFWFLPWQKLHLQPLPTLLNVFLPVCKFIHSILKMSTYTNMVYIGRYLVLTYIEEFISTVCCFFSYICWSVNCMSWVSKLSNCFQTCRETEARFIFEILILSFMESSFLTPPYIFCFFYLVCNLFKGLFQTLWQSFNCIIWVFES